MSDGIIRGKGFGRDKRIGRLKVLGFIGKWADRATGVTSEHYLCRCHCGRKIQVKREDLDSGAVFSCPDCVSLGRAITETTHMQASPMPIDNELTKRLLIYYNQLPKWYWNSLGTIVDEICQMDGRGTYTDAQICKYFECPQEVLDLIRKHNKARIKHIRKETERIREQFSYIEKVPAELIPAGRFCTIFSIAMSGNRRIGKIPISGGHGFGDN